MPDDATDAWIGAMFAVSCAITVANSSIRPACASGTSSPSQSGAYQRSSSSVWSTSTGHMHRNVNAPVSMGTTRFGKIPKLVDV